MIGCWDSYKNKYFSFFYHKKVEIKENDEIEKDKEKKIKKILKKHMKTNEFNVSEGIFNSPESNINYDCRYLFFNNEKTMLKCFIQYIKDINPDIWDGFFIETFDLVYIINRCKTLRINYRPLSPLGEVYISHGEAHIRGSIIYDLARNYAKWQGSHRHANSLKKLAETHLKTKTGKKITKTSDSIIDEDWYDNNWKKFIEYCLVDVELCVLIEKELGLIEIANRLVNFAGVNPNFVRMDSHLIESLFSFLKSIYEEEILKNGYKIAFDTKTMKEIEKAVGAIVLKSIKGIHTDGVILLLDLSKMYPEIVRSLNISVETLEIDIKEEEKLLYNFSIENGVYYKKEPIGFVPFAFKFLFKLRKEVEDERDQYEYGSKKYKELNKKRQPIKDSVNAVTGQFDYAQSIIVLPECANSIRLTGQKELILARDYSILFGKETGLEIEILYGDTDSVFVMIKGINNIKDAKIIGNEICRWIQTSFDKLAKEMNLDNHYFNIGLEAIMDVFLSIGMKKKYFGHLLWADGHEIPEERSLYVKGFETRRSDSSELTDKAQKEIFMFINSIKKIGMEEVKRKIIGKIKNEYMNEFSEDNILSIGIPKKLKKPFDEYKVTNPWLEGSKYANKYLNGNFDVGSKPKLLYIKKVNRDKMKVPPTNVLCVEEGMIIPEDVFIIDKQTMLRKTVLDKLKKVLSIIGIDEDEIFDGLRKTNLIEFANKYSNNPDKEEYREKINIEEIIRISNIKLAKLRKEYGLKPMEKNIKITK